MFLIHGLALAVWLCLGHALGLVPVHVAAARQATAGALAGQDVVVGLAGLTTLALIGLVVSGDQKSEVPRDSRDFEVNGRGRIRTYDQSVNSRPLYH